MTIMYHTLSGIYPAFMTAFCDDAVAIDCNKIRQHARSMKTAGVDGLYTGGSSGEMILCSVEERMRLLETVMEVRGDMKIIAHVGAMSTADSVRLAKHAAAFGADAISSVTPLYFKYTFAEIKGYYERLCDASDKPVIIYSIPGLTGTNLDFDQIAKLLSIPGVGGMKFTMSDFYLLNRIKHAFPEKVIFNGFDEMLLQGLSAGADGGIGTTYNFMPEKFVSIYHKYRTGDIAGAAAEQTEVNQIVACVLRNRCLPASKHMVSVRGYDLGPCREPFLPLTKTEKADLAENAWKLLQA